MKTLTITLVVFFTVPAQSIDSCGLAHITYALQEAGSSDPSSIEKPDCQKLRREELELEKLEKQNQLLEELLLKRQMEEVFGE